MRRAAVVLILLLLSGCEAVIPPTPIPTRPLSGPTLAATAPVLPAPPSEVPGSFIDRSGASDPTAAALPNNLELPPLARVDPQSGTRTAQIALSDHLLTGALYDAVPVRAPGVLLLGTADVASWAALPTALQAQGYVTLVLTIPADLSETEFRQILGSFADYGQGDDSRLDPGRIAVIGEQAGADLALRGCAVDARCDALALLTPTDSANGIPNVMRYGERPLLIVASEEFPVLFVLAQQMRDSARGTMLFQPFVDAGAGAAMLQNRPDLTDLIAAWLADSVR